MKKLFFAIGILIILPMFSFAWTDISGSTDPATQADLIIADIVNDGWDRTHNAFTVYNISTGAYHNRTWIWNGSDWVKWEGSPSNYDGQNVSSVTIGARTFLYGFNGTSWDRLRSNNNKILVVETTTGSTISRVYEVREATSAIRGGVLDEILRIVESTSHINGGDIDNIFTVHAVNESTSCIAGGQVDEILRVLESSCVVNNFPSDYPDSTSQASLSSIDGYVSSINDLLTSGTTVYDSRYTNNISTGASGKMFSSGSITIPGRIDGYSFYSDGGKSLLNMNWKEGTLYCLDGIPIAPTKLSIPVDSPAIDCVLDSGTTLYWDINCVTP